MMTFSVEREERKIIKRTLLKELLKEQILGGPKDDFF